MKTEGFDLEKKNPSPRGGYLTTQNVWEYLSTLNSLALHLYL